MANKQSIRILKLAAIMPAAAARSASSSLATPGVGEYNLGGRYRKAVKFHLIDKVEFASSQKLIGIKQVSLAEEYLGDHFPTFPVLPGVLMLEALTQAAAWVLHLRSDFACSIAVMKEARNVKYGTFVAPGNQLRVEVELSQAVAGGGTFKAIGMVGTAQAVSARLELAYFNLGDRQPELAFLDRRLVEKHKARWAIIAPHGEPIAIG